MIQLYAVDRRHNLDIKTHTLHLNTHTYKLKVKDGKRHTMQTVIKNYVE